MARVVTIRGTWSRTNTHRWEVYDYRPRIRQYLRNRGVECEFNLPQAQKDPAEGNPGVKSGTFTASVPLSYQPLAPRKGAKIAKKVLEALLEQELCRPPSLRVDWDRTDISIDNGKVPVL